jgi:glyoxylase-like metal-dependent hydrolase (beta-lactamase superfamily II)
LKTAVPGVYVVPGYSRSYVIDGDDGVTLIDTGLRNRHEHVIEVLRAIGRKPAEVKAIAITHAHADHFGGAAALKGESHAPLFASHIDAPAIRGDEPTTPPPLVNRFRVLTSVFSLVPAADPVVVDRLVKEGESAGLPEDIRVIDTPGHTPGHVSYLLDRAGGVLFVGDAAVATRTGHVKRGFFNAPTAAVDASLRHLAELQFETALFAHSRALAGAASAAFRQLADTLDSH